MLDRELIGNGGTAGCRSVGDPDGGGVVGTGTSHLGALVARPYFQYERADDRDHLLGLDRPRRHHNSRSTITAD
jgi:hypothetical protein